MNLDELKKSLTEINELKLLLQGNIGEDIAKSDKKPHPMLNKRCVVRTYSAGVHIGDIVYINPENSMELKLENALRLWKWEDGGLSLSAVANNGIVKGRLNKTGEVYLTNAIEMIPTTGQAEQSFLKWIEN